VVPQLGFIEIDRGGVRVVCGMWKRGEVKEQIVSSYIYSKAGRETNADAFLSHTAESREGTARAQKNVYVPQAVVTLHNPSASWGSSVSAKA
jgi:hypothetical protein